MGSDELHNDIEWIFVGGVRLIVEGVVVRLDVGTTDQQTEVQMFIGQTF